MWKVGILIFDGADEVSVSDLVGILSGANSVTARKSGPMLEVHLLSARADQTLDAKTAEMGGALVARSRLGSVSGFDVFWLPSGDVRSIAGNADVRQQLTRARSEASIVAAVGTGCAVLASAGLLKGCVAVDDSEAAEIGHLPADVWLDSSASYVDQGDLMTARASSASDLALHLVARTGGRTLAVEVARRLELHWNEQAGAEVPPMAGEGLM